MTWIMKNIGLVVLGVCILAGFASVENELHTLSSKMAARESYETSFAALMPKGPAILHKEKPASHRGINRVQRFAKL